MTDIVLSIVMLAALPVGSNALIFAQRYDTAQELTTASMGLSTVAALLTLSLVMLAMSWLT